VKLNVWCIWYTVLCILKGLEARLETKCTINLRIYQAYILCDVFPNEEK
jgi:hypothetical protein